MLEIKLKLFLNSTIMILHKIADLSKILFIIFMRSIGERTNGVRKLLLISFVSKMFQQLRYRIFLYIFNISSPNFDRLKRIQSLNIFILCFCLSHFHTSYFSCISVAVFAKRFCILVCLLICFPQNSSFHFYIHSFA